MLEALRQKSRSCVFFDLIHLAHDLMSVCSEAIVLVPALIARRVDLNAAIRTRRTRCRVATAARRSC